MKAFILLFLSAIFLASCTKDLREGEIPSYMGTYDDGIGNSAIVSGNGGYTKIDWERSGGLVPYVFDSVVVNQDWTFTDNESVTIQWPLPATTTFKSVGVGHFATNTLSFIFVCNGATITFNGIKKN